jgi:ribosomal protein L17
MKTLFILTRAACLALLVAASTVAAHAQRLQIDNLSKLEAKAAEVVDVTIDEKMLRLASKFLSAKDPEQAKVREIIAGLKGVYVKVFEFDKDGEYSKEDVESVRSQLRAPGWTRIVNVVSRRGGDNVEVAVMTEGEKITGLAIIAAEPNELAVVNIVGPIDLEKLSELEGNFGIPKLGIRRGDSAKKE